MSVIAIAGIPNVASAQILDEEWVNIMEHQTD